MNFLKAIFSSLAFIVVFPFWGGAILLKHILQFMWDRRSQGGNALKNFLKNVGLFLIAPCIALFYMVVGPVVGVVMLVWMAWKDKRSGSARPNP